jgi:invasion protein IalB
VERTHLLSKDKRILRRQLFDFSSVRRLSIFIAIALISSLLMMGNGLCQTKIERTFGTWRVVCVENEGSARKCSMLQSYTVPNTKQLAFVWVIGVNEKKELGLTMTVPPGVSIKEGVRISLGQGEPRTIAFDLCGTRACTARAPLDNALLQAITGNPKGSANYVTAARKQVQIELDLSQFKNAYDYFIKQIS